MFNALFSPMKEALWHAGTRFVGGELSRETRFKLVLVSCGYASFDA